MASIGALFAILLLQGTLLTQTSTQSVEGVVVDRVTSAAIAGADVELTGIAGDRIVSYTGKTDPQGKFAFRSVAVSAGYWLIATHEDIHVQTLFGQRGLTGMGTQIPVAAGQQVREIRLPMIPTGDISGRVLTNEGKPLKEAQVLAMTVYFREGDRKLGGVKSLVMTDGRGEYRIRGLPPGAYTVRAIPRDAPGPTGVVPRDMSGDIFSRSTLFEEEGYPGVYFPGVRDQSLAQTVDLRAGAHLTGIDVSTEKVRTHRIRGTVIDAATRQPVGSAQIRVIRRGAEAGSIPSIIVSSSNGSFDERGVVPGAYFVVATAGDPRNPFRGRVALDMANTDIDDLQIPVGRGYDLSVRLSFEGSPTAVTPDLSKIRITLKPKPPSRGLGPAPTLLEPSVSGPFTYVNVGFIPLVEIPALHGSLNNGTLTFRGVNAWEYSVLVDSPLEDAYIKSIRMGDRDILADGLSVDSPLQDSLRIVMSADAGRVSGRVVDADRKPASTIRVVLVPESANRGRHDLFKAALTGEEGSFEFRNVSPGNYKVFAFEHVNQDLWLDDSFLHLYEAKGKAVRVEQNGRVNLELQPIPPWY